MATYSSNVEKALLQQCTLRSKGEHCSADPDKLASVGRAQAHQIRVQRNKDEYALYTVSETRQEQPETIVRMVQEARLA